MMKEGDRKVGRSAYNEQSGSVEKVLAMSEVSRKCQGLEINYGKVLLVLFMRPPELKALSVMRPLGP